MNDITMKTLNKPLFELDSELGESPIWSVSDKAFYWLDIDKGLLYKHPYDSGKLEVFSLGMKAGCIAPAKNGQLIVATSNGLAYWNEYSGLSERMITFFSENDPRMMNDGKVDAKGNFWVGSKGPANTASLYRVNPDFSHQIIIPNATISNGLDWAPDEKFFYYCDSGVSKIVRYRFSAQTQAVSNPELFYERQGCTPDGLTVDREGNIWTAIWGGSQVVGLRPSGEVFYNIQLPVTLVTSLAFGGPQLNHLLITTARVGLIPSQLADQPLAGSVFCLELPYQGRPAHQFG
ncbi:MAG: SMP-30/gluconolactonase/LRE family protein [Chloroflexi bacterium]|nr:SMP-30/gluconolactonase/LRE family protein [Chloroflexota bacterium]